MADLHTVSVAEILDNLTGRAIGDDRLDSDEAFQDFLDARNRIGDLLRAYDDEPDDELDVSADLPEEPPGGVDEVRAEALRQSVAMVAPLDSPRVIVDRARAFAEFLKEEDLV